MLLKFGAYDYNCEGRETDYLIRSKISWAGWHLGQLGKFAFRSSTAGLKSPSSGLLLVIPFDGCPLRDKNAKPPGLSIQVPCLCGTHLGMLDRYYHVHTMSLQEGKLTNYPGKYSNTHCLVTNSNSTESRNDQT